MAASRAGLKKAEAVKRAKPAAPRIQGFSRWNRSRSGRESAAKGETIVGAEAKKRDSDYLSPDEWKQFSDAPQLTARNYSFDSPKEGDELDIPTVLRDKRYAVEKLGAKS